MKFVISFAILIVLSFAAVAQAYTPAQQQTKDACEWAAMSLACNKTYYIMYAGVAMDSSDMALISRFYCVLYGATPAQLVPGDFDLAEGDTHFDEGQALWVWATDVPEDSATSAWFTGNSYWRDGFYSIACSYYNMAIPEFALAEEAFSDASEKWQAADADYTDAWNFFNDLMMELMFGF